MVWFGDGILTRQHAIWRTNIYYQHNYIIIMFSLVLYFYLFMACLLKCLITMHKHSRPTSKTTKFVVYVPFLESYFLLIAQVYTNKS